MSSRTQYGVVGAQQATNAELKTYKDITHQMDVRHQATETVIHQRDQFIQSQQMML